MRRSIIGPLMGAMVAVGCASEVAEPPALPDVAAHEAPLRRLTSSQYRNTVRDVLGDDVVLPPTLEPDVSAAGLIALGASRASTSVWGVEQYEAAAFDLAEQAIEPSRRARWVTCAPSSATDRTCAAGAIEKLGLRLWRRPLTPEEREGLLDIAEQAGATLGDFYAGLSYAIAAMLQSPAFLYRSELNKGGRLDDFALASRLSYFLWNTAPDEELLNAAAEGRLSTAEGLSQEARRLLDSPRARVGVRNFFSELLELYRLDDMVKDPTRFVHFDSELGAAAREETLMVIEDLVFEQDGDFRDLMTTRKSFVNRRLAAVYEVLAPAREGFGEVTLPENGNRRGLLGHASTLALHSHPSASSAVLRGHFVRKVLLCGVIPPPPVGVNTALPEPSADAPTLRERNKVHLEDASCAGCHALMDPIGLGLENFDGIGRWRVKDNEAVIDASGDLDGTPFADAWDLAQAVRDHPALPGCLVRNLYRYATGVEEKTSGEGALQAALTARFEAQGYSVRALLFDIATSSAFARTEEGDQ